MKLLYPIFKSYYEALEKLNFGHEIFVIKMSAHSKSLESVNHNKNLIKILGKGKIKYPGYPSGNQNAINQTIIMKTLINNSQIPVLYKHIDGHVEYIGLYRHLYTNIKISDNGFRYYEFTLQRYNNSRSEI
jgi:hypothetical protein